MALRIESFGISASFLPPSVFLCWNNRLADRDYDKEPRLFVEFEFELESPRSLDISLLVLLELSRSSYRPLKF
jgi:hypothetical protein